MQTDGQKMQTDIKTENAVIRRDNDRVIEKNNKQVFHGNIESTGELMNFIDLVWDATYD